MTLEEALIPMQDIEGYVASAIYDMSGEVLAMHNTSEYQVDLIGTHAVRLIGASLKAVAGAELGEVNFIQVNSEKGIFGANWAVENKSIAAVLLKPDANVGLAKLQLTKVGEMAGRQLA